MVEQYLLTFLAKARASRGGVVLTIVGVLVLFATLIFGLASVVGNAVLMTNSIGRVVEFLGTGPGVLVGFATSVILILLGVAFLMRATPQTQSVALIQKAGTTQAVRDREVALLQEKLHKAEQERDRYRALQVDPNAKRQHEEESLRHRCIQLGQELLQFMKIHGYSDETVNRFVQRHEWKVNELRDELDERARLTTQERDTLTFHADDYSHKIEDIANTLVLLGRGH